MARHGKKLPLDSIKEALADGRVWVALGVVTLFEGETSHYELEDGDLLVDVQLVPNGEPLLCRLGTGHGIWAIPPVGAEVLVALPEGDFEANPVIVGVLISSVPNGLQENTYVVQVPSGGTVKIHDGSAGDCKSLVTKEEFNAHSHTGNGVAPTVQVPGTSVLKAK